MSIAALSTSATSSSAGLPGTAIRCPKRSPRVVPRHATVLRRRDLDVRVGNPCDQLANVSNLETWSTPTRHAFGERSVVLVRPLLRRGRHFHLGQPFGRRHEQLRQVLEPRKRVIGCFWDIRISELSSGLTAPVLGCGADVGPRPGPLLLGDRLDEHRGGVVTGRPTHPIRSIGGVLSVDLTLCRRGRQHPDHLGRNDVASRSTA